MMSVKPPLKFVLAGGIATNGKAVNNPTWSTVERRLGQLQHNGGAMSLEIIEGGEFPFDSVDVLAEHDLYLLTYLRHHSRTDSDVYELFDHPEKGAKPMIEMGGNLWAPRVIGTDFTRVRRAFKEFYETGKISLSNYGA